MSTLVVTVPEAGPGLAQTLSSVAGQDVRGLFDEVLVALHISAAGLGFVATEYGATVVGGHPDETEPHLRNRAAAQAVSSQILLLEAGERLVDTNALGEALGDLRGHSVTLLRHTLRDPGDLAPEPCAGGEATAGHPIVETEHVIRGYDRGVAAWAGAGVPELAGTGEIRMLLARLERTGFGSRARLDRERRVLAQRITADPHDCDAFYHQTRISRLLGEPEPTLRWGEWFCRITSTTDPRAAAVHVWMAQAAREVGHPAEADQLLARGLQRGYPTPDLAYLVMKAGLESMMSPGGQMPGAPSCVAGWVTQHKDALALLTGQDLLSAPAAAAECEAEAARRRGAGPAIHGETSLREPDLDHRGWGRRHAETDLGVHALVARTGSWIDRMDGTHWCPCEYSTRWLRSWGWTDMEVYATHVGAPDADSSAAAGSDRTQVAAGHRALAFHTFKPVARATLVVQPAEVSDAPDSARCVLDVDFGQSDVLRRDPRSPRYQLNGCATHPTHFWPGDNGGGVFAVWDDDTDLRDVDALVRATLHDLQQGANLQATVRRTAARACADVGFDSEQLHVMLLIVDVQGWVGAVRTLHARTQLRLTDADGCDFNDSSWSGEWSEAWIDDQLAATGDPQ